MAWETLNSGRIEQIIRQITTWHEKEMQRIFKIFGSFKFKKSKMEIVVV